MRTIMGMAFVAALVAGRSAVLAMTQDEALRAIRQQVSDGGGGGVETGAYAWMAVVALGLSVVLLVIRWRRGQKTRKPGIRDANKLIKEMRREVGMSRRDVRRLRREAAQVEKKAGVKVGSPLVMVLCPSLKGKRAA